MIAKISYRHLSLPIAFALMCLAMPPSLRADLGETAAQIQARYAREGVEALSDRADAPAETVTQYKFESTLPGGKTVKVWFKGGQSVLETHLDIASLKRYTLDDLRRRNKIRMLRQVLACCMTKCMMAMV